MLTRLPQCVLQHCIGPYLSAYERFMVNECLGPKYMLYSKFKQAYCAEHHLQLIIEKVKGSLIAAADLEGPKKFCRIYKLVQSFQNPFYAPLFAIDRYRITCLMKLEEFLLCEVYTPKWMAMFRRLCLKTIAYIQALN